MTKVLKPIGRPTKYDPKYCEEIIKFFDVEPYRDIEVPHMGQTGEFKWMDYKRVPNDLPTIERFAHKIGVNGDTLVEWSKHHPDFSAAYIHAKELQKNHLIQNGLNGIYNPYFTTFVAKNITDMKDSAIIDASKNYNLNITIDGQSDLADAVRQLRPGDLERQTSLQMDQSTPQGSQDNSSSEAIV